MQTGERASCEGASRVRCRCPTPTEAFWSSCRAAVACRGRASNVPRHYWGWTAASGFRHWPSSYSAPHPHSGAGRGVTNNRVWTRLWSRHRAAAGRYRFPPLQRAQIVQLACLEPIAKGLQLTHWSSADLAREAINEGIVSTITPRTIRRILNAVDLQPHRTRYWKTARLDESFKRRTEKVLWCYANAQHLARQGYWVVCVDEMPNLQALERRPIRRAKPGLIERQEFEYVRHGTVNLLAFLIVHSGNMEAYCPERKTAAQYITCLRQFRRRHRHLRGVFLIQDNDSSHTARAALRYFDHQPWWRARFTPPHASWLNQAEMLNNAFGRRYLKRRSWTCRQALSDHLQDAWPEYNRLYAHPFEWTWTNAQMRRWFEHHATKNA